MIRFTRLCAAVFGVSILFLSSSNSTTERDYPLDYFISPVDKPILLSGTFGELRDNHFHSGIDIKAHNKQVGQPIFACAEGFVSRIKIESGGYGRAVYVDHPNGYTTVYAHLDAFFPELERFVKDEQYRKKTFVLDIEPDSGLFEVLKGQELGVMGMTGNTFGPHLHFEIRETRTGEAVNPLHFGFKVRDEVPPFMNELKVYQLNEEEETIGSAVFPLKRSGKNYRIAGQDTLLLDSPRAGFGIKTYDQQSETYNWNGVYRISLYQDDSLIYRYQMDAFHLENTRYLNAHIDYEEQIRKKSYFNRCFLLPGNQLNAYPVATPGGVISVNQAGLSKITVRSEDIQGNHTDLVFWVRWVSPTGHRGFSFDYFLPYNEASLIENEGIRVYFPKGCLYENLYFEYIAAKEHSEGIYSPVFHLHNYRVPVHRYFLLAIQPEANLPEDKRDKAFIGYCNEKNEVLNCGGKWKEGNWLTAEVRDLGDFSIMLDETPPEIHPVSFRRNLRGLSEISFRVKDNIKATGKGADLSFRATIDGNWILMEYDRKNDLLKHTLDGRIPAGIHEFELVVADPLGNIAQFFSEVEL